MSKPRILTLDIETFPMVSFNWGLFNQNIYIDQIIEHPKVVAWAAKWHDDHRVIFRSEFHHGKRAMIEQIYQLLDAADIVVHFNGASFDMPWIRSEGALMGFQPYSPIQEIDLYRVIKKAFRFPSYKLDYVVQRFELGAKVHTGGFELWRDCYNQDPKAWRRMRKYNIHDVRITEALYDRILPYITNHPNLGLFADDDELHCPNCQGTDRKPDGYALTKGGRYPKYQCKGCGRYYRDTRRVGSVSVTGVAQ